MEKQEIWHLNTKVLAGLDQENKRLHLLDLDQGMSLTNALSKEFCEVLLYMANGHKFSESEYDFICYHTDSMISKFDTKTANFEFLATHDQRVDEEFKKEMFYLHGAF